LNHIHKKLRVVCPLHPRTRKIMDKLKLIPEFDLIDPVGYFDMIALLQRSKVVLTDSGGLQKEAFFFNSPCVTMRDQTEWVELVENGFNMIAGADSDQIIAAFNQMIDASPDFSLDLYGKGKASENIASIIASC